MSPSGLWKCHGARNDFLLLEFPFGVPLQRGNGLFSTLAELRSFARRMCDRHGGFGADGLVVVDTVLQAHALKVLIVNSDGSLASTCGNALRCVGLHALNRLGWNGAQPLAIERGVPLWHVDSSSRGEPRGELADDERDLLPAPQGPGVVFARLLSAKPRGPALAAEVDVSMGHEVSSRALELPADLLAALASLAPAVSWRRVKARFVQLSNPHVVIVGEGFHTLPWADLNTLGRFMQSVLPARFEGVPVSNIGFLSTDDSCARLTVYERGAGLTQCCGSGATAARVALEAEGLLQTVASSTPLASSSSEWCEFEMPGGVVAIGNDSITGERVLRGPAECVGRVILAPSAAIC